MSSIEQRASPSITGDLSAAERTDYRLSRRAVIVVTAVALVVGMVVVLQLFVAERIPGLTEARLDTAEKLWQDRGPADYDMDLILRGAQPGNVHIEVRSGEPIAMTRDGRSPPRRTWDVWSVRGMFETLEREMELAEDPEHEMHAAVGTQLRLRSEFDPQYGFPRKYHRYASGGAPEVYWRVVRFEPH